MTGSSAGSAETDLGRKRRARRIGRVLAETHPDAHCELDHSTPLELAVATILSAQCTDKRVNEVTPKLFARYRTAADYAAADRAELEELIRPTGFFRNKTDSLIKLGQALVERYDGEVPGTLDDLVTLPGIGRKTANVILGNAFDVPGITVDTHFQRLVQPVELDRRDRPGQDRARGRGAVRTARLDDAVAPGDLPRPAGLPRPQAGLRGLHAGQALPVVRHRPDRAGAPRPSCSRARAPGTSPSRPASTRELVPASRPSRRRCREPPSRGRRWRCRALLASPAAPPARRRHRLPCRSRRRRRAPLAGLAGCAAAAPAAAGHRPAARRPAAGAAPVEPALPELTLPCFTGGEPVALRDAARARPWSTSGPPGARPAARSCPPSSGSPSAPPAGCR